MTCPSIPRRLFSAAALAGLVCLAPAFAQDAFPSKPLKVIVPYPAGGNADNIARVFTKRMGEILGQPLIVDNRGGASGTIGAEAVHRADADGYTLLLTVTSQLTSPGPTVKTSYNAVEDFTPVVGLAITPLAFAVPASLGVKNLKELEALSKTRKLSYGSYGAGTSTHLMQHLLVQQFGAKDAAQIPYKGESPMVNDMLGGQIDMGFIGIGQGREMNKSGRMRILAVVGKERSEFLPDVQTFAEQGYKDLDWTYGVAVYASSRMPAP
ncbi:MAG: tripartite tricarboxylate transporter substrate binding protein, partial [Burkholderiaceae bacterium]